MGLFDFFRGKPAQAPENEGPSAEYVFAHYALRQIALSDPLQFLAVAASSDSRRFVEMVLQDIEEKIGRKTSFDASSVDIHSKRVGKYPCAVVQMPEPSEQAEAFMVALVVPIDAEIKEMPKSGEVKSRYFTLEKGMSLASEPRTVLAEWDSDGHSHYGDGPDPSVDAFVDAIKELME